MSVLTKNDLFNKLHEYIGDSTTEESIGFMEDVTDTFNDMESRMNGDGEDWKKKYEENDKAWRAKYRHRFFSSDGGNFDVKEDESKQITPETITVDDLFTRKEN